ncbi:MAG: alpha-N-arabinofuranosidase [Clostridia bacterium]|nr:alpha-N-arabinofuranosidase [Clostridia bacterium]
MKAKITLHRDFKVGAINPYIYGSFIEHMGRGVYNGIYEPTHPLADKNGFREDVKKIVRDMHVPIIRYPGGNFLSGYHWEDGVGPKEKRPRKLDAAWQQIEPNEVGTDEFHDWAREVESEVMMAVNLGTRGPDEAAQLLEYCNMPAGSTFADMRVAYGHEKPHGDRVWCLGNEMDDANQICCRTAEDYAAIARKSAGLMKKIDPSIKLVACGSATMYEPTFGEWELTVLDRVYDHVDYLSLHQYYPNDRKDRPDYLANALTMEEFITGVIAMCDAVGAKKRSKKKINLSFDEWNVWPQIGKCDNAVDPWSVGPQREEYFFTMEDALLFGSMMMNLIRHCDRVHVACMAQLINVCAPIMTVIGGPAWVQSTYYPFCYTSQYGRGVALNTQVICDGYKTRRYENVPWVDSVAVWNQEENEIVVFAVNRSQDESAQVEINMESFGKASLIEHVVLEHEDKDATNTAQNPDNVKPHAGGNTVVGERGAVVTLNPYSWNMIRLALK